MMSHSHIRGIHGLAQLSRSKKGPETDGYTVPYAHNSGSQQGKSDNCHSINGPGISGPGGPFMFNIIGLPEPLMPKHK